MGALKSKFHLLEIRLQGLVEGGAARLLPSGKYSDWPSSLVSAMHEGSRRESDGSVLAPNLFTLSVSPKEAGNIEGNQALLTELAGLIERAAEEAGLRFHANLKICVESNPAFSDGQWEIQARVSPQSVEETDTFSIDVDDAREMIPVGAFLIFNSVQIYPLTDAVINLGRRADNHLVLDDPSISREHAQLRAIKGRYVIFDLESTGGTFVNGARTSQATLFPGDVISLAGVSLVYGQEAGFISDNPSGGTQPIVPFPPDS